MSVTLLERLQQKVDAELEEYRGGLLSQGAQAIVDNAYELSVKCELAVRLDCAFLDRHVPFPVSWTVKMKKKQKETQDILSYHTQAAGCSDKARAKASGGRQPIEECGRTGL